MSITIEKTAHTDELIVTHTTTRRKWWLFGPRVEVVRQYVGSSTVWHTFPDFERCGTSTECWLADIYAKWKFHHGNG